MPTDASLVTIGDWRRAYAAGASVRELIGARLAHLASPGSDPAWILRLDAQALASRLAELEAAAEAAGSREALLARMPLFGVPFAVKDNIDVAGLPTTAACPAFTRVATRSATVVQRLFDAGAVLVGKTNLDQFATGLVGTRSPYGRPASVFDASRVSGGSSAGSAVVVARGDVAFALGTDTAGSGRVPAAFNHIVGLKPTPGRVSTAGVLPACRSIDCVSVFALDVDDAATVLAVVEGPDAADDYSDFRAGPASLPAGPRIGVPRGALLDAALGYDAAWAGALRLAGELGGEVVEIDFEPLHAVARLLYEGPWVAERHAVVEALLERDPAALDPTVARVIGRAVTMTATETFRAQYALRHAQAQLVTLWQQFDLLMVPSAPRHPSFAEVDADPVGANAVLGTYTNFVNLLGWSALALPACFTSTGLPFGVTFIAPGAADAALAGWGRTWQRAAAQPLGAIGRAADASASHAIPTPRSEPVLALAVVGAHLSGLPLNHQLVDRGATLASRTATAPAYRLFALPGTTPPKPGLLRVGDGGVSIELEVWNLPLREVGSFLAGIPSPLGLGSVLLADGRTVHGFLCEPFALEGAQDVSRHGGWRGFLACGEVAR